MAFKRRRVSGGRKGMRHTMRKSRRTIGSSRNVNKLSTRRMAVRSHLTRPDIAAVEYEALLTNSEYVHHTGDISTGGEAGSENGRFTELGVGWSINYNSISPLFNCFPQAPTDGNQKLFRVLGGICVMRLSIVLNAIDTTNPVLSVYHPQKLYCRIIGVRQYITSGIQGSGYVHIPAYTSSATTTGQIFHNLDAQNMFVPSSTFNCIGEDDWYNARFADWTDPNADERTKNKRLIYDKKFVLHSGFTVSSAGGSPIFTASNVKGGYEKTIRIKFPPGVVKLDNPTSPANYLQFRETSTRFFMCVKQPGVNYHSSGVGLAEAKVSSIKIAAKSKFTYVWPANAAHV